MLGKGKSFKVKGTAIATSGPTTETSPQTNKWAGATLVFIPEEGKMQNLKLGVNTAEFTNIVTPSMNGGNPIAATTFTPVE